MKTKFFALAIAVLFCTSTGFSQSGLFIDNSFTADQMIMDFFNNSCVTPSNITFNGAPASIAYFEGANTNLGVPAGILITSGDVSSTAQAATEFATGFNSTAGDADIEALIGVSTFDAAVLEFDIATTGGDLDFQYIFGSEEYPEFVNAAFNDAFAFFVSGSGISGTANIAMVPSTSDPVSINNVNAGLNSQYFVDNLTAADPHIVYDGLTTELQASFTSIAAESYHMKIVVADAGDAVFDSGVFIGIESLCGQMLLTPPAIANITVDGSSVAMENLSRYATSWHWEFGDGGTSDERYPDPYTYAIPGTYELKLTTQNYCCTDEFTTMVTVGTVGIEDLQEKPFKLYPNPADNYIYLDNQGVEILEIQIFNVKGQKLSSGLWNGTEGWDISHLNNGVYLVNLITDDAVFSERIIKKQD